MDETSVRTIGNTNVELASPWVFFAITFAITWGFWIPAIVLDLAFDNLLGLVLLLLGLFGPGLTGVLLMKRLYTESAQKDFWDRLTSIRRIGGRWYLAVFLYAPITFAIAAGLDIALGGTGGSILASILLHSWTNFTLQTLEGTLRTDILFYAGTLWAFVVLAALIYGAKTLASHDHIPIPPSNRNRRSLQTVVGTHRWYYDASSLSSS